MSFTLAFLGHWEVILIVVIILLLFGAKKLPGLARSMGKSLGEFKKGRDESEEALAEKAKEVSGRDVTEEKETSE